jgi:predicted amidohydrolase
VDVAIKNETFFLESEADALKFISKCSEEDITAVMLPVQEEDGRKYYPVRVTYDTSKLKKK